MTRSAELLEEARSLIPGGVNSPVRAFGSVGGVPPFLVRGEGCKVTDADGKTYIDYVASWGPLILGHAHPEVLSRLHEVARAGTSFGAPTELEIQLARLVSQRVPSVEQIRMVSSGTEATMSALRLARGYTGRSMILKFDGCYHGHADCLLVNAGSGLATLGIPGSPGVTEATARDTLTAPYNDLDATRALLDLHGDEIAAIIVEPVAGNMGVIPPLPGFLDGLREESRRLGILLVFDEVMTGFRVHPAGAQGLYAIEPDLSCFGKIIGGGLPVGAYGGRRDIMQQLAPVGPVYQAGTLSGNPLAMAAGIATLEILGRSGIYETLEARSRRLADGLLEEARRVGAPISLHRVGSMLSLFFRATAPTNFAEAREADTKAFGRYFHAMLERGVYLAPSAFEAAFVGTAHTDEDIELTLRAHAESLRVALNP